MMLLFSIPQQYNNLYFIDVLLLLHPILNYFVFLIYIRLKKSGKEYNNEKYLVEYINHDSRYKIKPLKINYFENSLTLTMHFRP